MLTKVCSIIVEKRHPFRKSVAGVFLFARFHGMGVIFQSETEAEVLFFCVQLYVSVSLYKNNDSS